MIILSTGSLYNYGIVRVFALAAETGFDGVEVLVDGRWDSRDPAYLRRLSSDCGLPIAALHSPFVPDVQDWPSDQLGRFKHTVRLAQELGVPLVVTHLPFRFYGVVGRLLFFGNRSFILPIPLPRREPYYYFLQDGGMGRLESSSGVIIALENMPARRLIGLPINSFWFNRPEDEVIGGTSREMLGEAAYKLVEHRIESVLAGEIQNFEETIPYPDGVTRVVDVTYVPDISEDGEVRGWFSLVQDTTERKRTERALRESERLVRLVTDNLPAFIAYVDKESRYRFANKTAEDWYGLPADRLIGKTVREMMGEDDFAWVRPRIEAALAGENVHFQSTRTYSDGTFRNLDLTYVPDFDDEGQVDAFDLAQVLGAWGMCP